MYVCTYSGPDSATRKRKEKSGQRDAAAARTGTCGEARRHSCSRRRRRVRRFFFGPMLYPVVYGHFGVLIVCFWQFGEAAHVEETDAGGIRWSTTCGENSTLTSAGDFVIMNEVYFNDEQDFSNVVSQKIGIFIGLMVT